MARGNFASIGIRGDFNKVGLAFSLNEKINALCSVPSQAPVLV